MRFSELTTFTLQELDALLDGRELESAYQEVAKPIEVQTSNQGPGYLNKWGLLESNENAWQKLAPNDSKSDRRKIILCNPIQAGYGPTERDVILIAALVEHCDVYLWPNNSIPMSEVSCIGSTANYWESRSSIKIASKPQVQKALAEQGINIDEYLILDLIEYQKIMVKLQNDLITSIDEYGKDGPRVEVEINREISTGCYLDFVDLKGNLTDIQFKELIDDGVNYEALRFVIIDSIADINHLNPEYLSEIDLLIRNPSLSAINRLLTLPLHGLLISGDGGDEKADLVVEKNYGLKKIIISDYYFKSIDLTSCKDLEVIHIDQMPPCFKKIALPNKAKIDEIKFFLLDEFEIVAPELREVGTYFCYRTENIGISFGNVRTINKLSLLHVSELKDSGEKLDLQRVMINEIELVGLEGTVILPSGCLEKIKLEDVKDIGITGNQDKLKEVYVDSYYGQENVDETQAHSSTSNFLSAVTRFAPHLVKLTAKNFGFYALDLSSNKHLLHLELSEIFCKKKIKFSQEALLEKCIITECSFLGSLPDKMKLRTKMLALDSMWFMDGNINPDVDTLEEFAISYAEDEELDFSPFKSLKKIVIIDCGVEKINLKNNSLLEIIEINKENNGESFKLADLDLSACSNLRDMSINAEKVEKIFFAKQAKPKMLDLFALGDCSLVDLDASELVRVSFRDISMDSLLSIKSSSLRQLKIEGSFIREGEQPDLNEIAPNLVSLCVPYGKIYFNSDKCRKLRFYQESGYPASSASRDQDNNPSDDSNDDALSTLFFPPAYAELFIADYSHNLDKEQDDKSVRIEFDHASPNLRLFKIKNFGSYNGVVLFHNGDNLLTFESVNSKNIMIPDVEREWLSEPGHRIAFDGDSEERGGHDEPKERTISCYNRFKSMEIDGETGGNNNPINPSGNIFTKIISAREVDISKLRIRIKSGYYFDENNNLKLHDFDYNKADKKSCNSQIKNIDPFELSEIKHKVAKNPSHNLGHLWGEINTNEWHVLPLEAPCSDPENARFYVDLAEDEKIEICWVPVVNQFIFRYISEDNNELKINIYYFAKVDVNFRDKERASDLDIATARGRLLPDELYKAIYILVSQHEKLSILINKSVSINEKHAVIVDYCSNFTNEELDSPCPKGSIKTLLSIISEMKGSCRHRSFAYLALTHFVGINSWINANENHAIGEVVCLDESESNHVLGIDMGGGAWVDSINDADLEEPNLTKEATDGDSVELQFDNKNFRHRISMLESPEIEGKIKFYKNLFDFYVKKDEIASISELFKLSSLPFVIVADDKALIFKINELVFREVSNNHQDYSYLYIHNSRELKQFYRSASYGPAGLKINEANGALMRQINKKSINLINFSTFTARKLADFKSVFERRLLGHDIKQDAIFVGIITPDTRACSAFYSRCKLVYLSPNLFSASMLANNAPSPENSKTVDFFERPFWQEMLYGEVKFKGKNVELIESLPVQAMRDGMPLTIYNPPKSDEFDLQLHRLKVMGSIFYNGEFLKAENGFSVATLPYSNYSQANNIIIIIPDRVPGKEKEKIVIGSHNLHKLYSQLNISGSEGHDADGLLHVYRQDKNVFYVLDSIYENEWQYLVNLVNKKFPGKKFEFYLSARASINGIQGESEIEMNTVCLSNDPYYHANTVSHPKLNGSPILVPVSPLSTFEQLVYGIRIPSGDGIGFVVDTCSVIERLLKDGTAILYGAISQQLFNELFTLLEDKPYYIDSENKRIEVKGRLNLILSNKNDLKLDQVKKIDYTVDNYLWKEEDLAWLEKIKLFYQLTNKALSICNNGSLEMPQSYHQLQTMIGRLKSPLLHPNNPIKGIILYNYAIDSDIYALMNVIAKYVFVPDKQVAINKFKLSNLIHKLKNKKDGEIDVFQYYFRILNCFSGAALKHIIGDDIKAIFHRNNDEVNERFVAAIEKFYNASLINSSSPSSKDRVEQLKKLLNDPKTPLVILKGAPGTGKTYTARKLAEDDGVELIEGESSIENWLKSGGDNKKVLLLDEANMALPGTWDFLKGIFHEDKTVLYKGKFYQLTENHKILAAVNPDDYPGRYEHEFFKEFGEVFYFKKPSIEFLKSRIHQLVKDNSVNSYFALDILYKVFQLYTQYQPYRAISIRDLESLVSRYCALIKLGIEPNDALYETCLYEYPYSVADINKRNQFIQDIRNLFQDVMTEINANDKEVELHEYLPHYYLTTPKQALAKIIEQDIELRQLNIDLKDQDNTSLIKRGVLLEGDSGVGKSTLYLKILQKRGYTENHKDLTKRYYHYSALDFDIEEKLKKAFHEGAIVVLDELDLAPKLEACLNHFLTGVDKNGSKAAQPGFMLLASQNGPQFVGREATPLALANRLHYLHVDHFTDAELIVIAKRVIPDDAEAFVLAYREAQRENRHRVNMRTFYSILSQCEHKHSKLRERDDEIDEAHLSKRQRKLGSKDSSDTAVSSSASAASATMAVKADRKRQLSDEQDDEADYGRFFKRPRLLDKNNTSGARVNHSSDDEGAMDIDEPPLKKKH